MQFDNGFSFLSTSAQVFLIDLLLSGDNAVVIAMACRGLPGPQMRQAVLYGTVAAIVLRLCFTTVLTMLLDIAYLKLAGAAALLAIAVKLLVSEGERHPAAQDPARENQDLWSAVGLVVTADVVMSLDNVVALAAAARGSLFYLALGIAASIPLLMYGSLFMARLIKRLPLLIPAGGALLGWIAGDIARADPAVSGWLQSQAPALGAAMPWLGAAYVLAQGRILKKRAKPGRS